MWLLKISCDYSIYVLVLYMWVSRWFVENVNYNCENSEKGWQKSFFIYSKWYAN